MTTFRVVVPWHNPRQLDSFLAAWGLSAPLPRWLILEQDPNKSGTAKTKNRGIQRAIEAGAEVIVILDDDCYPNFPRKLDEFAQAHIDALAPQPVTLCIPVSAPPSRGTPYFKREITMPVAASMGFWTGVPDFDGPAQLVRGVENPIQFYRKPVFGHYFALCGMNLAFRVEEYPWCKFVEGAPRFDDIWQGFLWQKKAYKDRQCFNLGGPLVVHSRQSNVWANLRDESINLEANETVWAEIFQSTSYDYHELLSLLPLRTEKPA